MKKNPMEILELKNIIIEIKILNGQLESRMKKAEERTGEL